PPLTDMKCSRLNSKELKFDLDMSLKALNTDYVDLYFLHRDDPNGDLHELMYALDGFVREGKVLALGASNFTVKRIVEANKAAEEEGFAKFEVSQIGWSYAETTPEKIGDNTLVFMNDEEYRGYLETGISVMAYSSQAKGFFAAERFDPDGKHRPYDTPENRMRRDDLLRAAAEKGISPVVSALEHITRNRVEACAIAAVSRFEQLEEILK
ncbi:aldo/keto reductase, partial [Candidatus Nomurabacteria bacterium]|nr:aldo/keto reductase [Candidatus Nomurabacteria bacterium]